ncbi:MAG: hypothetical protein ACWGSQ_09060 [Longimicrobiales bacterium]
MRAAEMALQLEAMGKQNDLIHVQSALANLEREILSSRTASLLFQPVWSRTR